MGSEFICKALYTALRVEWIKSDQHWEYFIESIDLGVECVDSSALLYRVTDPKKWSFTKLKYGI